ncbi:MAG: prepilin-type N-terminal cleavage/methylation domain-containing protein [Patescibacteria group bacterium]
MRFPRKINSHGFTLIEMLVAVSIFAVVATIASGLFINSFRISARTGLENQILNDATFIIERLARDIHENAIDYDEYFSRRVLGATNYGVNYGKYNTLFYHPGLNTSGGIGDFPEDIGEMCNDGVTPHEDNRQCDVDERTEDTLTPTSPYENATNGDPNSTTAFCNSWGDINSTGPTCGSGGIALTVPIAETELYLIAPDGGRKLIFAKEKIGGNSTAISVAELAGSDTNGDGTYDSFQCDPDEFTCNDLLPLVLPLPDDLTTTDDAGSGHARNFIPLSPLTADIRSLYFYISPLEDPYRATGEDIAREPQKVTIVMEIGPNTDTLQSRAAEEFKTLTLTRTVVSGVGEKVPAPRVNGVW